MPRAIGKLHCWPDRRHCARLPHLLRVGEAVALLEEGEHGVQVSLPSVPHGGPVHLITEKSGNVFRVGIFLDFVRQSGTTRAEGPHGAYVRRATRSRVDPHRGEVERPTTHTICGSNRSPLRTRRRNERGDTNPDACEGLSRLGWRPTTRTVAVGPTTRTAALGPPHVL